MVAPPSMIERTTAWPTVPQPEQTHRDGRTVGDAGRHQTSRAIRSS